MTKSKQEGAGCDARTFSALKGLWELLSPNDPRLSAPAQVGQDAHAPDLPARLALITPDRLALCAWWEAAPTTVACTSFTCAGAYGGLVHPSVLIWGAEVWAWERWPGARLTVRLRRSAHVWPDAASFFVQAGWREVGMDHAGRTLLERLHPVKEVRP
jgi:hypothetical protein